MQFRGIDFLGAMQRGEVPPPPIALLLDFAICELEVGRVVFECTPDQSHYNPIGMVHGGLVCTLADTVIGCAVHTTLDLGLTYTSIDLNVSYLRPVTGSSGVLRATGRVTKPGRRVAFAAADIVRVRQGGGHGHRELPGHGGPPPRRVTGGAGARPTRAVR